MQVKKTEKATKQTLFSRSMRAGPRCLLHAAMSQPAFENRAVEQPTNSLFVWLVADGWCWFVLREKYCWLVAGGWFVLREKYCWLVADKASEQGANWRRPFGEGRT
jgi:hypothetical protein